MHVFNDKRRKMPKINLKTSYNGSTLSTDSNCNYYELKFPEECLFNINDAFENFKNDMEQTLEGVRKLISDLNRRFVNIL